MTADELYACYYALRTTQRPDDNDLAANADYQQARNQLDQIAMRLAAAPGAQDKYLLWMVDFIGTDPVEWSRDEIDRIRATGGVNRVVLEQIGGLGLNVARWLQAYCGANHEIAKMTDAGGGPTGWHLGVHCNASAAWRLKVAGREAFKAAVASNLLRIDIKPWTPYVP